MSGEILGYVRVSTVEQNEARQLESLASAKKLFIDKVSGKDTNRPKLLEMIDYAREGDTIMIHSLDRLARNLDDLRKLVTTLNAKGVRIHFVKEGLTFTGEDNPMSKLILSTLGAFAEFERAIIKERQKEGIEIAKKEGKYLGRSPSLNEEQIVELKRKATEGVAIAKLARAFNISRPSVYKYLGKYN
ncbi:MAG: recombinase family protein [Prevotella sp.]